MKIQKCLILKSAVEATSSLHWHIRVGRVFGSGPKLPEYEPTSKVHTFTGSNSKHPPNPQPCWTLYWFWDTKPQLKYLFNKTISSLHYWPSSVWTRVSCVDSSSWQRIRGLTPQECREGVAIQHTVNQLGKEWRHITPAHFNSNSNVPLIIFDIYKTHFIPDCKT